jgi:uncharacterized membrane protein
MRGPRKKSIPCRDRRLRQVAAGGLLFLVISVVSTFVVVVVVVVVVLVLVQNDDRANQALVFRPLANEKQL